MFARRSCPTCGLSQTECPGHFGHIELNVPCYNPILFDTMFKLLRLKCFNCHKFRAAENVIRLTTVKLGLLDAGLLMEYLDLAEVSNVKAGAAGSKADAGKKGASAKQKKGGKGGKGGDNDDAVMSVDDAEGALEGADPVEVAEQRLKACERRLKQLRAANQHTGGRECERGGDGHASARGHRCGGRGH